MVLRFRSAFRQAKSFGSGYLCVFAGKLLVSSLVLDLKSPIHPGLCSIRLVLSSETHLDSTAGQLLSQHPD